MFAVLLYIACAALIVAEVFVPSGGLLSICALACLVGGVAIFFRISPTAGWLGVLAAIIMVPLLLIGAYKLLPRTRFGRNVLLAGPVRERGDAISDTPELIKMLEETPDTLITLVNGERFLVEENADEIVDRVIEFGKRLRAFPLT